MTDKTLATALLAKIKAHDALVGIIGMGYVGLPLALAFVEKGFPVLGFDGTGIVAPWDSSLGFAGEGCHAAVGFFARLRLAQNDRGKSCHPEAHLSCHPEEARRRRADEGSPRTGDDLLAPQG